MAVEDGVTVPGKNYPCAFCGKLTRSHRPDPGFDVFYCHGCEKTVPREKIEKLKADLRAARIKTVETVIKAILPKVPPPSPKNERLVPFLPRSRVRRTYLSESVTLLEKEAQE